MLNILLCGNTVMYNTIHSTWKEPGFIAIDDGLIVTENVVLSSDVNIDKLGQYLITYSIRNETDICMVQRLVFVSPDLDGNKPSLISSSNHTNSICRIYFIYV